MHLVPLLLLIQECHLEVIKPATLRSCLGICRASSIPGLTPAALLSTRPPLPFLSRKASPRPSLEKENQDKLGSPDALGERELREEGSMFQSLVSVCSTFYLGCQRHRTSCDTQLAGNYLGPAL